MDALRTRPRHLDPQQHDRVRLLHRRHRDVRLVQELHHADVGRIFLFILGASLPFALVNVLVTRGFRQRFPDEPGVVIALATSFSALSIAAAVGAETALAAEQHEAGGSG